jgi:hemerythrin superfamily protein
MARAKTQMKKQMEEQSEAYESANAFELLREDHHRVQELFDEFEQADNQSRKRIAEEALRELEIHAKLEEELIYPAIRQELDEEELMDMALEEHHVVTTLIRELRKMQPKDRRYAAKFKVMAESVKHHIEEEESEILPQAEKTDLDASELGRQAMQQKHKLMEKGQRSGNFRKRQS